MRFVKDRYIVTVHESIVMDGILGKLGRIDPSSRGCNEAGNTYDDPKRYPPLATIPRSKTLRSPRMNISYSSAALADSADPALEVCDVPAVAGLLFCSIESQVMFPD